MESTVRTAMLGTRIAPFLIKSSTSRGKLQKGESKTSNDGLGTTYSGSAERARPIRGTVVRTHHRIVLYNGLCENMRALTAPIDRPQSATYKEVLKRTCMLWDGNQGKWSGTFSNPNSSFK